MLDVPRYLERIGCVPAVTPSSKALSELQRGHLLHIPFENLDIHFGRPLSLELDALEDKVVHRRRGGFCYELNGLFAELLRILEYDVSLVSAQVYSADGVLGPAHDHLALLVDCEGRWLVDVGFGDAFIEPLNLDARTSQRQRGVEHRFLDGVYSARKIDGEFEDQYVSTLESYQLEDFEEMCRYHQTSKESNFTKKVVCSRLTETGRVTATQRELIFTEGGERTAVPLADDSEWKAALLEHFDVRLDLPSSPT